MHALSALTTIDPSPLSWTTLFAKEPDADVELDASPDVMTTPSPKRIASPPPPPPDPPSRRPLFLILLLVAVAATGYFMMDPTAFDSIMDLFGSSTPKSPLSTISRPSPSAEPAGEPVPKDLGPQAPTATAPPAPTMPLTAPQFTEGQRVAVLPDALHLDGMIPLTADAVGTRPGVSVRAGSAVTILDGDIQHNDWVYLVRTEDGGKGWIKGTQLKPAS